MLRQLLIVPLALLVIGGTAFAEGRIREIPGDWESAGMRRLKIGAVKASSMFGSEGGQYSSSLAIDGNRGSKWVASVAPSEASPQWIELKLLVPQEVAAVAVFGGTPGNDGVQDGQIQVAGPAPGEFSTVAVIKNAKSASWLATFDRVKTSAVRLLVTRSEGPSPHTDIGEVEVFGPLLSEFTSAELKAYAAGHIEACRPLLKQAEAAIAVKEIVRGETLAELKRAVELHREQFQQASERFTQWESLQAEARCDLVERVARLEAMAGQLARRFGRAVAVWPARAKAIESARRAAREAGAKENVIIGRSDTRVRLLNNRVLVDLSETDGTLEVTWLGKVDAAIRGARFSVGVDGQELRPEKVKAQAKPFTDKLGAGVEIRQFWGEEVRVERMVRVYHGKPAVVISGSITNKTDRDVSLQTARMVEVSTDDNGWWHAGCLLRAPAMVGYPANPACRPAPEGVDNDHHYGSSGVLVLAHREPPGSLALGYLTAQEASPGVSARFRVGEGGTALAATLGFGGRKLAPGKTVPLDTVCVSAQQDPFAALESYGDAVAALSTRPVRTGANALWCSWYPIRMGISEEVVFENAEVIARHFKPLGMDVVQLDHGWQRGDVCGDWFGNERFSHGMKWLAEQLRARWGLKLGLWIAPSVVAQNTQTFREHPDWLFKDAEGKPRVLYRWYWKPNPQCYTLDSSHPEAAKWIEDTFARLSADGVSYYKIDFLSGGGGNPHDPYCVPSWGVLRRAMESIRRGAGPDAWVRYNQTPPLLAVGLAHSSYIGADTGDAGLGDGIGTLGVNSQTLAATYWINDRLYHREVCDMSVGPNAKVEEARLRLAIMTLSGCSISYSDDLRLLPPPRIHMMQQCLPPGSPPMKPLDLFDRAFPSVWHVHCKNDADGWDVVGLFNFENDPQERAVQFASLGLPEGAEVAAFEFWEEKFLGVVRDGVSLKIPPRGSRILSLRRLTGRPQVIGTDMHVLGGYHELGRLSWDEKKSTLSGRYRRAPGLSGKAYVYVPAGYRPQAAAPLTHLDKCLWLHQVKFKEAQLDWSIPFDGPAE